MEPFSSGPPRSLRSIPPGTLAAACSGDLFGASRAPAEPSSDASNGDEPGRSRPRRVRERGRPVSTHEPVACAVFEVDPPIPLTLSSLEKARLAPKCARLVHCNDALAHTGGYASVSELEGASLQDILGRSAARSQGFFEAFFEHDLLHEGILEEEGQDGQIRRFTHVCVGVERDGMLCELISTQTRACVPAADCDGATPEPEAPLASPRAEEPALRTTIRKLKREQVEGVLERMHEELLRRRHALLEYQLHGPSPHLLPRVLSRFRAVPEPDPQRLFDQVQATTLSVLRRAIIDQCQPCGTRAVCSDPAVALAPGRIGDTQSEFSGVLSALDRALPGAAERVLAEVLLHWKAKEEMLRRQPPSSNLLGCLAPRAVRSALRVFKGDPSIACVLRVAWFASAS